MKPGNAANQYATAEEFCRVFAQEMDGLYQLSFLLTGDHAKSERCFVAALEDCAQASHVLVERVRLWAKRTIIQNAICELNPHPCPADSSFSAPGMPKTHARSIGPVQHFESYGVLDLGDFERFVFVMSVLERYAVHECALLLSCSQRQVLELGVGRFCDSRVEFDHPGMVVNEEIGARARLRIGRAYAFSGDKAKARAADQDFLTLPKDANHDIPILKQASAEYQTLQ